MDYEIDPNSGFPKSRSGEVIVHTKTGKKLSRRESILPDEPAVPEAILEKFMDTACSAMSAARARRIRDVLLDIERLSDVRALMRLLSGA